MGRHETFENAVLLAGTTFLTPLPAAGSPEAMEAFGAACRAVDAASRLSDAEMEALHVMPGGASLWTSDTVTAALSGNFSWFSGHEIEAARATPRARLEEVQILALRRELRMAEAARSSRIRELHALVYGDEPDPDDGSEAPTPSEPDPIFALIEARAQTQTAFDAWGEALGATPLTDELRAEEDVLSNASLSAYERMISTPPTTAAGRLALLDRLRIEIDLHGMANGDPPHEGHHFWTDFFDTLRGAMAEPMAGAAPTDAPFAALAADPHLVAMVAEWQGQRSRIDDQGREPMSNDEMDAASEQNSALQIRIHLHPARSAPDLRVKVPVLRDELRDATRGCKDQPPTTTLAGAAWTGLFADIERIAGTAPTPAPADDAELIELGRRFDAFHALWREAAEAEKEPAARREAALAATKSRGGPYDDDLRAAWALPGVTEAHDRTEKAFAALEPVMDEIAASPARTAQGIAVKVRALIPAVWPCGNYERDGALGKDQDWDGRIARQIIESCCAAAGVDWRGQPLNATPDITSFPDADAGLIALGHAFDLAASKSGSYASGDDDEVSDIAGDEAEALAHRIAALPARTIEGMRAKLRVAAFYRACDPGFPAEEGYPGEAAIRSLYRDTPGIEITADPADIRIVPEASATGHLVPSLSDQILACWRERAAVPDLDRSAEADARDEHLYEQMHVILDAAAALPATMENLPVKALALAFFENWEMARNGQHRDTYFVNGRLALDIDTAICGRLRTGA